MDNPHPVDELVLELESIAIRTSQGSYVKMDDVRRLVEKRKEAETIQEEANDIPQRMTVEQARGLAKEHLRSVGFGPQRPQEPGRSIAASEPQPSSRT